MKTVFQPGQDSFQAWADLGALLHRAGNFAVVDRGALCPGEQLPYDFERYQVIDFEQECVETHAMCDVAIRRADDLFLGELFALQDRVLESAAELSRIYVRPVGATSERSSLETACIGA